MLPETFVDSQSMIKSQQVDPDLAHVRRVRPGAYEADGLTNDYYVLVDKDGFHCSCPAGQAEHRCWHIASVYRLRQIERQERAAKKAAKSAA